MTITTAELKKDVEKYLERAETDPVIIENMGRMKSVVISYAMSERLMELEDGQGKPRLPITGAGQSRGFAGKCVTKPELGNQKPEQSENS